MKTIEITSGNQTAQFTTKSVTFGGREYFYANMANVENDIVSHIYTFTYDGEFRTLPYEEKDAKVLNAIFSQVRNLKPQNAAPANVPSAPAQNSMAVLTPSPVQEPAPAPAQIISETQAAGKLPTAEAQPESFPVSGPADQRNLPDVPVEDAAKSAELPGSDAKPTEPSKEATPAGQEISPAAQPSEEKTADKLRVTDFFGKKKEKNAASNGPAATPAGTEAVGMEQKETDPEKKARLNKSLKIFCIIIAAVLVVSVIYYFVVGTPTDPAPTNPNSDQTQQYDDIDELIEDLQ